MLAEWPVAVAPRWQAARWLLFLPVLPFYGLRRVCRWAARRNQLPMWMQAALFVPAVICLGLPTRLYELAGIVTVLDESEATNG